ncbi:MAG: CBS domain-containing protein [Thermodesulfobacteriota bacterium]|nr:CBS domain-containing protein [Thermodesulfobacteriota bacterium]
MKKIKVKDLLVHLEEYATVNENSSLSEAIEALEKAQQEFDASHYTHRAILVYDDNKTIVGKLSQWDVIKGLEPKYETFGDIRSVSLSGLSTEFISSMIEKRSLWQDNLDDICNRVANRKVKEVMYRPTEGEKIDENATLGDALHSLIIGHHQSLLVTRENTIVGILRLVDVFKLICERIKSCRI